MPGANDAIVSAPLPAGIATLQRRQFERWLDELVMQTDATLLPTDKIRCDRAPVMCYIKRARQARATVMPIRTASLWLDPHIVLSDKSHGGRLVPFQAGGDWDGKIVHERDVFVTAIGAGTTYPDYKPAPFMCPRRSTASIW